MNLEEKIKNDLRRQGVDATPTSVLHDLFIRKFVQLHTPFEEDLQSLIERMDFSNFGKMTHDDLVKFGGNFFVSPRGGEKASGVVRLYYPAPLAVHVPGGTIFFTEDNRRYTSDFDQSITSDEMIDQIDGIYYYLDVFVTAEGDGEEYNANPGEINQCDNLVIASATTKIENPRHLVGGMNVETAEELFRRTKETITVHSFANNKSIRKVIRETFDDITKIYIVRAKSEEMLRDRLVVEIDGTPTEVRVGNMVDVYIDSLLTRTEKAVVYNNGRDEIPFGFGEPDFNDEPLNDVVIRVLGVRISDALGQITGDEVDGWHYTQGEKTANSTEQEGVLTITDPSYAGTSQYFEVEYIGNPRIRDVQELLWSDEERMPVGDYLARGFNLLFLSGVIRFEGSAEAEELQKAIESMLLSMDARELVVSDIVEFAYHNGASKVTLPITLRMERPDGSIEEFGDRFTLDTKETFIPRGLVVVKEG